MRDNVIDGRDRFGSTGKRGEPRAPLDQLRETPKVRREDRALLAQRLGEAAAKLSPARPRRAAKPWFEQAWPSADRWAKRKRLICFPGENPPDPNEDGAYVATGADWAKIVEGAAKAQHPDDTQSADAYRQRAIRDILRGTEFLEALPTLPSDVDGAQALLADWARKLVRKIEDGTGIRSLWAALKTTPFDIQGYDLERPDTPLRPWARFDGDQYSAGPLGDVSRRAAELYGRRDDGGWRFELGESGGHKALYWPYPQIRMGLRGHRRLGRIFVIPEGFWKELPRASDFESGEAIFAWLILKGLVPKSGVSGGLPDIRYEPGLGYGWASFAGEYPQDVWLSVRPREDGATGVWVSISRFDEEDLLPKLSGDDDTLARLATSGRSISQHLARSWDNRDCEEYHWPYCEFEWPAEGFGLHPEGEASVQGFSGIVDLGKGWGGAEGIEGWIDDLDDTELQAALFGGSDDIRFVPSIDVSEAALPPASKGTPAAAIFANLGCQVSDRLAQQLIERARIISSAGLAFHSALIAHNRGLVETMFDD